MQNHFVVEKLGEVKEETVFAKNLDSTNTDFNIASIL